MLIKTVFQTEKDELIYINALNSMSYFSEAVWKILLLNAKFIDEEL